MLQQEEKEREKMGRVKVFARKIQNLAMNARIRLAEKETNKLQHGFKRIREATGITDVNEVVSKYLAHQSQQLWQLKIERSLQNVYRRLEKVLH